jgi:23S rRNA pseudouridine2604 synthase
MDVFPMRINKYLAHIGVATRNKADELISRGLVTINGRRAVLGDKIQKTDKIKVSGKNKSDYKYLAYNKAKGIVSTNPQNGERSIMEVSGLPKELFPIGRLDKESHGLIIISNDGRITDRLLNPEKNHEKEYLVEVDHSYSQAFLLHMQNGVLIGEYKTKPAKVKKINERKFSIILTEGKNRQIRRMTEKLGYKVTNLCRTRIQNILLKNIPVGQYREIIGEERELFLKSLGLNN